MESSRPTTCKSCDRVESVREIIGHSFRLDGGAAGGQPADEPANKDSHILYGLASGPCVVTNKLAEYSTLVHL